MQKIKQSSATRHTLFLMVDSTDHVTGKTGLTPTVTISKNAAAFASPAGAVTEVSAGWYKLAANATDSNTLGILALHATGTAADPTDLIAADIVAYDPDDTVRLGLTALPNAAADAAGGLPISDAGGLDIDAALAKLTGALPEAYRADGATGTFAQLLYELVAHAGESSISGTVKTTKKIDGTTTAATYTLDSATTPTSITRAT